VLHLPLAVVGMTLWNVGLEQMRRFRIRRAVGNIGGAQIKASKKVVHLSISQHVSYTQAAQTILRDEPQDIDTRLFGSQWYPQQVVVDLSRA
jgi:hypothetical protein